MNDMRAMFCIAWLAGEEESLNSTSIDWIEGRDNTLESNLYLQGWGRGGM